jgi:hypothetical protein
LAHTLTNKSIFKEARMTIKKHTIQKRLNIEGVKRSVRAGKIKGIETTKRDIRSEKINNISKNQQQLAVQKKQY